MEPTIEQEVLDMSTKEMLAFIRENSHGVFPDCEVLIAAIAPLTTDAQTTVLRTLVAQMFVSQPRLSLQIRLKAWVKEWQLPLLQSTVASTKLTGLVSTFSASLVILNSNIREYERRSKQGGASASDTLMTALRASLEDVRRHQAALDLSLSGFDDYSWQSVEAQKALHLIFMEFDEAYAREHEAE